MHLLAYPLLLGFLLTAQAGVQAAPGQDWGLKLEVIGRHDSNIARQNWQAWVLKVEVVHTNGSQEMGSAVIIAPERLVTNCHVLREASRITVSRGETNWTAHIGRGDAYRDLCFLDVPGLTGNPPTIAQPQDTKVGTKVVAAGYSGGNFAANPGQVKGLFSCACDGGKVIQTSTYFDPGASGGGLFDLEGRLLGILTFKALSGGNFHFAVPVGWMEMLGKLSAITPAGTSFWESPYQTSGYFLAACDLSARGQWKELLKLSQEWANQESSNPQAWMAQGRAYLGLGKPDNAVKEFQQVLLLDSTHAEAMWELQKLELDLGHPLTETK